MAIQDLGISTSFVAATPGTAQARPRGVFVGTGGDVVLKNESGTMVLFKNVPSGSTMDATSGYIGSPGEGTTAADIVLLY